MYSDRIVNLFKNFSVSSAIDIVLMAVVLYLYLSFIKKQHSPIVLYAFFAGVTVIGLVMILSNSTSNLAILMFLVIYCVFTLIIYSNELKRAIFKMSRGVKTSTVLNQYQCSDEDIVKTIKEIVTAAQDCSKSNTGLLLVVARSAVSETILESGTRINADLSKELIETIFYPKCPLHDGAAIVYGNKIIAASCYLPLTQDLKYGREFGTRHRAGIGVTENQDVLSVMVSEETGVISTAYDGEINRFLDSEKLEEQLKVIYGLNKQDLNKKQRRLRHEKK